MQHGKVGRKFSRKRGQRKAFLKGLANNLVLKGAILTTEARAKETRSFVERLVTIAKKQNLASFRLLRARVPERAAEKLYFELAKRYEKRAGGCLRIIKREERRKRDGVALVRIEFIA